VDDVTAHERIKWRDDYAELHEGCLLKEMMDQFGRFSLAISRCPYLIKTIPRSQCSKELKKVSKKVTLDSVNKSHPPFFIR